MIAPLVATEIHRITGEDREVPEQEALPGDSVVPGWRLLVTAADEVVVRSPEGGPGAMTIPADGGRFRRVCCVNWSSNWWEALSGTMVAACCWVSVRSLKP